MLCILVIAVRICRITLVSALHLSGLVGGVCGSECGLCMTGLGGRWEWPSIGLTLGGVGLPIGPRWAYAMFVAYGDGYEGGPDVATPGSSICGIDIPGIGCTLCGGAP